MPEQENGTGRLAACPACVEHLTNAERIHTDEEWVVHSLLAKPAEQAAAAGA